MLAGVRKEQDLIVVQQLWNQWLAGYKWRLQNCLPSATNE